MLGENQGMKLGVVGVCNARVGFECGAQSDLFMDRLLFVWSTRLIINCELLFRYTSNRKIINLIRYLE